MRLFPAFSVRFRQVALAGSAALAVISFAPAPAISSTGSDNTMFKRHFWRGQAYHGEGYHPQISDIGREQAGERTSDPFDATVID